MGCRTIYEDSRLIAVSMMSKSSARPETDAVIVAGLSPPVLPLACWLLHESFALRHLHVIGTTQGIDALRETVSKIDLPPHQSLSWHGREVDGTDGDFSQEHYCQLLAKIIVPSDRTGIPLQLVLGGGVNWMIGIASQLAVLRLSEAAGDGLWTVKTLPDFENHPHYLKPGDPARIFSRKIGFATASEQTCRLQRVLLLSSGAAPAQPADKFLDIAPDGLGKPVALPPLQLAFYHWLLRQTKLVCRRPQLPSCEACYACALPAKHLPALADDFREFYLRTSPKPGYVRPVDALDFPQRVSEYVSKINANIRRLGNLALFRQLRISHGEGGYLPGVDKNHLKGE
jgi:hypothetical protein